MCSFVAIQSSTMGALVVKMVLVCSGLSGSVWSLETRLDWIGLEQFILSSCSSGLGSNDFASWSSCGLCVVACCFVNELCFGLFVCLMSKDPNMSIVNFTAHTCGQSPGNARMRRELLACFVHCSHASLFLLSPRLPRSVRSDYGGFLVGECYLRRW